MLDALKNRAVAKLNKNGEVFIDPATITLIGGIVIEIIKALKECRNADTEYATKIAHDPSWIDHWRVYRATRRKMGWRSYRRNGGSEVVQAILDSGKTVTPDELEAAYKEV